MAKHKLLGVTSQKPAFYDASRRQRILQPQSVVGYFRADHLRAAEMADRRKYFPEPRLELAHRRAEMVIYFSVATDLIVMGQRPGPKLEFADTNNPEHTAGKV